MATAYIGLGSNIEPERHLRAAVAHLRERLQITALSPVYRTPPWGVTEQADFLNAVLQVQTTLASLSLLDLLQEAEQALKRKRVLRWGPRTIDLDLLDHAAQRMCHPRLELPHPRLHERAFALKPLSDIAPHWRHPRLGQSISQLLAVLDVTELRPVSLRLSLSDCL